MPISGYSDASMVHSLFVIVMTLRLHHAPHPIMPRYLQTYRVRWQTDVQFRQESPEKTAPQGYIGKSVGRITKFSNTNAKKFPLAMRFAGFVAEKFPDAIP